MEKLNSEDGQLFIKVGDVFLLFQDGCLYFDIESRQLCANS